MTVATPYDVSGGRYVAKKLARRLMVRLGQAARPLRRPGPPGVRVLTWHRFGHAPRDPCCVTSEQFRAQLGWLASHARVLTPGAFDSLIGGTGPVPRQAVLLTIDDGDASVAAIAAPALARAGLRAVLFVCPGLIEGRTPVRADPGHRFLDWDQLGRLAEAGHEIAPHGDTHRSLGTMPLSEALEEIGRADERFESRLGRRSAFFAFPFGTRADYSGDLVDALRARGYRHLFTTRHGTCVAGDPGVLRPRVKIEGGNELALFPAIVDGALDHWRIIDDTLYRIVQQRGRL